MEDKYSLADDYIKNYQKYDALYDNVIVLCQVGSFFEIYEWDLPDLQVGNTRRIAKILNFKTTLKNKTKSHSKTNCIMAGFTQSVIEKYTKILLDNFFTVIIITQDKINPNIRTVSEIISPGTNLNPTTNDNSFLMCIYLEEISYKNKMRKIAGISLIDISTGKNHVSEITDVINDEDYALNETIRLILSYQPVETIIYNKNIDIKNQELINLLCLNNTMTTIKKFIHPDLEKISYQTTFLDNIFKDSGLLNVIEYLNLEKHNFARLSYILLLKFVEGHNSDILNYIHNPLIIKNVEYLHLDYNTSLQLNLISEKRQNDFNFTKVTYTNVFSVLDNTRTVLGKRLLKYRLLHPIKNIDTLKQRYQIINELNEDDKYKQFLKYLDNINDLERFQRKLSLKIIEPCDFDILDNSYSNILDILNCCDDNELLKNNYEVFFTKEKLNACIDYYNNTFDIEKMKNCSINKIDNVIYHTDKYDDIKLLYKKINETTKQIILFKRKYDSFLVKELNKRKKMGKKLKLNTEYIKIEYTNNTTYLTLTKTRANILEPVIKANKENAKIKKKTGTLMHITSDELEEIINNQRQYKEEFRELSKQYFLDEIEKFYNKFNPLMKNIISFISEFDFLISGSICSIKNNYCEPIINNNPTSYFNMIGMRHPIIEKINEDVKFITNDLHINDEKIGMILSGINGIGKCHGRDTPIIMYDGTIKLVQDIKEGDFLMGDDSKPRKVLSLARGTDEMYKVSNKKGDEYIVNKEHILCLKSSAKPIISERKVRKSYHLRWFCINEKKIKSKDFSYNGKNKSDVLKEIKEKLKEKQELSDKFTISVKDYLELPQSYHCFLSGYKVGIEFPEKEIDFDPYIIGAWLGDGHSSGCRITNQDASILKYFNDKLKQYDCYLQFQNDYTYGINSLLKKKQHNKNTNNFLTFLRKNNLINNKHIPYKYKCNSIDIRLKVLAGLIDTDGYYGDKYYEIIQKNNELNDDIVYLARSLGFACYSKKVNKYCFYKGEKRNREYNKIMIYGDGIENIPVLCKRKMAEKRIINKDALCGVIKLTSLGKGNYYGFELDGNHKYLLENFTVTHNTSLMKNIGINIVIAQIGYFVPAKSMEYYPFDNILTRIMGNDNILTGSSSYAVEINELRGILQRSNNNSLILIDEFARGTEFYSALSLTASCIEHLSNVIKPKFVITTHLHRLFDFEEITSLKNVMIKYMDIDIDENDVIIYKRKLKDGVTYKNYGLKIAKALGISNKIISRAETFRNILLKEATEVLPTDNSKYNSNFYIKECEICKTSENLEVHHIDFQCNSNETGFFEDGNHKNNKYNLITLCKEHHIELHQGKYKVHEREMTTNGISLKIEKIEEPEELNKENLIELILNLKFRNTFKYVKEELLKQHNLDLSMYKIKKIFKENI